MFKILDMHDKEWFIVGMFPHIRITLMQQQISSNLEALDLILKIEASPLGNGESNGMTQV